MVWFPGGAFEIGSASIFDGSALAAYENVLVVTIQYRLGIFGFFTTQDQHTSGNLGFKDQLVALSWVQKNINFFSGDPGHVTIFGESAGVISVSSPVLCPMAIGLFHRAIMERWVAILPYLKSADDQRSKDLQIAAEACDCNALDSLALLTCLREKSSKELLSLGQKTKSFTQEVDGLFFPEDPLELLTQQTFKTVPSTIGVNDHECCYLLPMKTIPVIIDGANKSFALRVIHSILNIPARLLYVVSDEYFHDKHSSIEIRDSLLGLFGDVFFVVPALLTARYHRDSGAPVYFYKFQHRPQCFEDMQPAFVKADHSDEIHFVFGGAFLTGDVVMFEGATGEEKLLSRKMMRYWSNFAWTGNPNGDPLPLWPAYNKAEMYLQLDLNLCQRETEGAETDVLDQHLSPDNVCF